MRSSTSSPRPRAGELAQASFGGSRRAWLRQQSQWLAAAGLATVLSKPGLVAALEAGSSASAVSGSAASRAAPAISSAASAEPPSAAATSQASRIVSLGGTLTEIIYALGAGDRLVGTDRSSVYPPEATKLPQVGYYRQFSVEGVVALKPDLVIAAAESGPPSAMTALKGLGIPVELLALKPEVDALIGRIEELAALLGKRAEGEALVRRMRDEVAQATKQRYPVRVLALSSHAGKLQGAGHDTAIDSLLKLLGATNVLADSHRGYKPLSAESVAALRPDAIVTSQFSAQQEGAKAFAAQPGIVNTPAARNRHIIVLDPLLMLGFGVRIGEALSVLGKGLEGIKPASGAASAGRQ